ncbi:MAG: phage tail protein [Desulfobacteraceae bacterium]|nr:phage tail protein [Desulfobacteraceae bacterium]
MEQNLSLSIVHHPFRLDRRETRPVPFVSGVSLRALRAEQFPADLPVLIYLNGNLVTPEKWETTFPRPGDYVLITPALSGGSSGKSVFRALLMIAVSAVALYTGQSWLALQGWQLAAFTGGVSLVGGLLVNALIPPATSKAARDTGLDSQVYSWSPQNTEQQGIPVAKWYGLHKIYGNIICSYLENQGDDQILNALICLGLGPVKGLANFKINDQPCQNFKEVSVQARYGYLNQTATEGFQNTKVEYSTSVEVTYGSPYTYLTTGSNFDMLEVDLSFPGGIWGTDGGSSLVAHSVDMRVEVRKSGETDWINITPYPEAGYVLVKYGSRWNAPRWSRGKWIDMEGGRYWWNAESGSQTYEDHTEGAAAAGTNMTWHWIGPVPLEYRKNDDSADLVEIVAESSSPARDFVTITDSRSSALRYTYSYVLPAGQKGQYEIRVTRVSENADSTTVGDRSYLGAVREVLTDRFRYPRHALLAVRATATDQLSGSLRFSCMGKMSIVQIWDGLTHSGAGKVHAAASSTIVSEDAAGFCSLSIGDEIIANGQSRRVAGIIDASQVVLDSAVDWDNDGAGYDWQWRHWTLDWSDNPAWVALDVLTQPVIGGEGTEESPFAVVRSDGLDLTRLDLARFKEWADFCDELVSDGSGGQEKRVTFNGGFDYDTSMWEALLKVCQVGRAVPVWNGIYLTLAIDKPAEPVNLYSVGNIEENRFKEVFLPIEERATEIEIDYTNLDNDYQRDKLTVYRTDTPGGPYAANLDLFGITKSSEAWRAGMYRLMCNRYLVRSAEIDVDIEALNCQIGDVVYVQHDIPRWGAGGRIVSAQTSAVTLDKEIEIEEGHTYRLMLRTAEDVIYERDVTNAPGTWTTVAVSPPFDSSADFSSTTAYTVGDRVRYSGRIYGCVRDTAIPSPTPDDESCWEVTTACPVPERYDVYAFGFVDNVAKQFRVTEISQSQDQKVTLSLIEYRPEVYEFEEIEPPVNDYTQQVLKSLEPQGVSLSQTRIMGPEGRTSAGIAVTFTKSTDSTYRQAEVWYAEKGSGDRKRWDWQYAGSCTASGFEITGVEFQKRYGVILIPVNTAGKKLYHGRATLYEIFLQGPSRAADIHYGSAAGTAWLHTAGTSTTVATTGDAFAYVLVGSRLTADGKVRTVSEKIDDNTVRVDSAVDWDNGGEGYPFTYDANLDALMPAEPNATEGGTLGTNIYRSDGETVVSEYELQTANGLFLETFENPIAGWTFHTGSASDLSYPANGLNGGKVLQTSLETWAAFPHNIQFDPGKLYRMRCRARKTSGNAGGFFSCGVLGVLADGETLCNTAGENGWADQHWICTGAVNLASDSSWHEYTGYFKGWDETSGGFASSDPSNPARLHENVRYFRPVLLAGSGSPGDTIEVDYISVDAVTEAADLDRNEIAESLAGLITQTQLEESLASEIEKIAGVESSLDGALEDLTEAQGAVVQLQADLGELSGRVLSAEMEIDEANGQIILKAKQTEVDGLTGRVRTAEAEIDGLEASIALKASAAELGTTNARMSAAEANIDGLQASIVLKAEQSELDTANARLDEAESDLGSVIESNAALDARISQAEIDIDGAHGAITLKASQESVESAEFRISAAELEIDGVQAQITLKVDNNGNVAGMGLVAYASWSAAHTYAEGDCAAYGESVCKSRTGGNLNHLPTDSNYWESIPYGARSEVLILADKFAVMNPSDASQSKKIPFVVGSVGGQSQVGISGGLLVDGTIVADAIAAGTITGGKLASTDLITASAQIGDGVITNAKINDLSADKITAGSLSVDRLTANSIVTGKIAANAATASWAAKSSSTSELSVSVNLTVGSAVLVIGKAGSGTYVQNQALNGTMSLYRGTAKIDSSTMMIGFYSVYGSFVCVAVDNPGPGSFTYKIAAEDNLSAMNAAAIQVVELRR